MKRQKSSLILAINQLLLFLYFLLIYGSCTRFVFMALHPVLNNRHKKKRRRRILRRRWYFVPIKGSWVRPD